MYRSLLAFVIAATLIGQTQYPPGQNPQGQGPLGGGGFSLPKMSRGKKNKKTVDDKLPVISAEGLTLSNDGKQLKVGTNDGRVLTMTLVPATIWTEAGKPIMATKVVEHTFVHVDAAEDDEAFLTAKSVELKEMPKGWGDFLNEGMDPGTPQQSAANATAAAPEEELSSAKGVLHDSVDDPDRPKLKRGKPRVVATVPRTETPAAASEESEKSEAKSSSPDDAIDFTISGPSTKSKVHSSVYDKLIAQTHEWAMTFTNGLPNFVCDQITTRYAEQSKEEGFQPVDVITAKVLYEDGREKYSEITVGGRRTNKSMMEVGGGSTSTGEFASVLGGLFESRTNAQFTFRESTVVAKAPAAIYDFKVFLPRSNWTISVGGQQLRPEYTGAVWVDKATAQVRRIEMNAERVPKDFPYDMAAETVDYEEVSLGTNKFLLPVHSENLICERGNSRCSKNTIDFRDYHKYSGESTIEFK